MIHARFRPLASPIQRPARGYTTSPFSGSWPDTLDRLEREIKHVRGTDIVIELDTTLDQIRNDGWPYSGAKIATPGVRVSFTSKHGPLCYTCATYNTWQSNLRAVALTLERLRAIDRYGCVKGGEQYQGWAKLPPGRTPAPSGEWASVEDAMRFLSTVGDGDTLSLLPEDLPAVYKAAARKAHPDAGGSTELMARVNAARAYVESAVSEVRS